MYTHVIYGLLWESGQFGLDVSVTWCTTVGRLRIARRFNLFVHYFRTTTITRVTTQVTHAGNEIEKNNSVAD